MSVRKFETSHRRDGRLRRKAKVRSNLIRYFCLLPLAFCLLPSSCVSAVNLLLFPSQAAFNQKAGGQTAPEFSLKDLKGKRVRLGDYKGKIVLVNFWATWCVPCRAEMPELVRWQREYKAQGLQIIGITFEPYSAAEVRETTRKLKINYPILLGNDEVVDLYEANEVLPLTVVIDRDGNIRDRIKGIIDAEEFEKKIKPLLQTTGKTAGQG